MDKLKIKGREFLYEIKDYECGDYGAYIRHETIFYDLEPEFYIQRKYIIFGPKIEKKRMKELFKVSFSIKDKNMTKTEVRSALERKVELLRRKEQIERGEII